MKKIIALTVLLTLHPSLKDAHALDFPANTKCGIFDVFGTVTLQNGFVNFSLSDGSPKMIGVKVLDAPSSLKLLDSFTVNVKLDVQKIDGQNYEATYVKTKDDIQVFPSVEKLSRLTLVKEEECKKPETKKEVVDPKAPKSFTLDL